MKPRFDSWYLSNKNIINSLSMIITIILVVLGIFIEKKFSPRLSFRDNQCSFHYTAKKGVRNKEKLFDL